MKMLIIVIVGYGTLAIQIELYAIIPAVIFFIMGLPFPDRQGHIGSAGISVNSGFEYCTNGALVCCCAGIILAII